MHCGLTTSTANAILNHHDNCTKRHIERSRLRSVAFDGLVQSKDSQICSDCRRDIHSEVSGSCSRL